MATIKFNVEGMGCCKCSERVEKAVKQLPCITAATVDLAAATLTCEANDDSCAQAIIDAVKAAGYQATKI